VTLSKVARWQNIGEAILLLMHNLQGRSIMEEFIDERFMDNRILPTTWAELKERHLVRETSIRYGYTLSGPGWIAGLKLRDEFDTDELKAMTGKLCAALKDIVKGRQDEAIVHVTELADDSDIAEAFIRNAIESDLIRELFGTKGAAWASYEDRGKFIVVPIGFGTEPL
jgi:hypothetical protein